MIFHGVMERARRSYRLPHNPVAGIEKPRSPTRTTINVFSPEEVHALVRVADCEVDAAIFLTAAFTGLRQGELVALRWRDVDWTAGLVRVRRTYTRGEFTAPKSRRSSRAVPLADRLAAEIETHFRRSGFQEDDDLVFAHPVTGEPYDASRMRKRFKGALARAGCGRCASTTCATRLARG